VLPATTSRREAAIRADGRPPSPLSERRVESVAADQCDVAMHNLGCRCGDCLNTTSDDAPRIAGIVTRRSASCSRRKSMSAPSRPQLEPAQITRAPACVRYETGLLAGRPDVGDIALFLGLASFTRSPSRSVLSGRRRATRTRRWRPRGYRSDWRRRRSSSGSSGVLVSTSLCAYPARVQEASARDGG
jgi:hypothetical protein